MADIVLIDDDESLRLVMKKILQGEGHTVRDATDGSRGVELVEEVEPDLVITDLIMPEKEGIETIMELREAYPGVRIMAVSGGGAADPTGPLGDAEAFGADTSLPKPFSVDEFTAAVRRVLGDDA